MKHGSLFSGMGGFDLAADWMGWENVFHCEWNEFGKRILKYYWPKSISYHDITKTDFTIHRGTIDVLTGGFPCQPFSLAGKRKGKDDERYLWPEMLRAIREIQPQYVVGENVPGLVNWDNGMVFEQVQIDLANEGYEVTPYLLPAAGIKAPHERERVWFVAYRNSELCSLPVQQRRQDASQNVDVNWNVSSRFITNSNCSECSLGISVKERSIREQKEKCTGSKSSRTHTKTDWSEFPTQSPVFDRNDGFSQQLDGITLSKWRNESIKAAGNAIVPQVALQIFKAIEAYEHL